jgi:hypothetical protein
MRTVKALRAPGARRLRSRGPVQATNGARDLASQLFGGHPERQLALLRAAWPAAVGPELARRTEVLGLEGRTLRVKVPDAGWRKVLHRMHRDILSRLYRTAGDLAPARLAFQEAPFAPAPARTPERAAAPPEVSLPAGLEQAAAAIEDDELRERFTRTAALYLQRRSCAKP